MSTNRKIIISTSLLATIFLLSTVVFFCLKYFCNDCSVYDFMITILGGMFASVLVVMVCEIQKYLINKKQAEDELFYHMIIAYSNTMVMKNIMEEVLNKPNKQVVKNSLTQCRDQVLIAMFNVSKCDYSTFNKKQKLFKEFQAFNNNINEIERRINNSRYFDIAINQEVLNELQMNPLSTVEINGTCTTIASIAKVLKIQFQTVIEKCEEFMSAIDYSTRYKWEERKVTLQQRNDIFAQDHSLESFLKENPIL